MIKEQNKAKTIPLYMNTVQKTSLIFTTATPAPKPAAPIGGAGGGKNHTLAFYKKTI